MARAGQGPVARQSDVDRLSDQDLLVPFGLQLDLALAQCLAQPAAGRAYPPPRVRAGLRRQRADLGAGLGERRPVSLVRDPRRLQLVEVPGGGDGGERRLPQAGYLLG